MDKKTMGRTSRAAGKAFELKVRKDLEKNGWIVCKWSNNISDVEQTDIGEYERKLIPAKHTFNPFTRAMSAGNGFPDFVCFSMEKCQTEELFIGQVQLVESKMTGKLDKIEKEKVNWIKNNLKIPVLIASKGEKRGEIKYEKI